MYSAHFDKFYGDLLRIDFGWVVGIEKIEYIEKRGQKFVRLTQVASGEVVNLFGSFCVNCSSYVVERCMQKLLLDIYLQLLPVWRGEMECFVCPRGEMLLLQFLALLIGMQS